MQCIHTLTPESYTFNYILKLKCVLIHTAFKVCIHLGGGDSELSYGGNAFKIIKVLVFSL